jgi:hypothetical protein
MMNECLCIIDIDFCTQDYIGGQALAAISTVQSKNTNCLHETAFSYYARFFIRLAFFGNVRRTDRYAFGV